MKIEATQKLMAFCGFFTTYKAHNSEAIGNIDDLCMPIAAMQSNAPIIFYALVCVISAIASNKI